MAGDQGEMMRGMWRCAQAVFLCAILIGALPGWAPPAARAADVPFVPTPPDVVEAMLGIAKVGPDDFLIDLGSGDGRISITAARKYGARGFGVDIDGALVNEARREAERQGVADKVRFYQRNLFITDIREATVLTMYLLPSVNLQLRPRILTVLKPGTRVVSHDFDMDAWQPDERITVPVPDKPYGAPSSEVFLWIVPADASGQWRWQLPLRGAARTYEVALEQTFQMLSGKPRVDGKPARLGNGRVRGERVSFVLVADIDGRDVRHEFAGRLVDDTIAGTVTVHGGEQAQLEWRAVRTMRGRMNITGR